jgi:hypothetical protein
MLYSLLKKIWIEEKIPEKWEEGLIVKILKKDLSNCNNWRGIILLSIPSKILTGVILNTIQYTGEQHLWKEQAGFYKYQSCTDLISTLKIILEQSIEWKAILYVNLYDFEKAFDSMKREIMCPTLQEYGIPGKITQIMCPTLQEHGIPGKITQIMCPTL